VKAWRPSVAGGREPAIGGGALASRPAVGALTRRAAVAGPGEWVGLGPTTTGSSHDR